MAYIVEHITLIDNVKYWTPMLNKDGFAEILNSKAEARNYLHDAGYTIDNPNVRITEVHSMIYKATKKPKGKKFFYEVFADGKLVDTRTSHNTYISVTVHQRGNEVWYVSYSSKMKVRNENVPGVVPVLVAIEEAN